MDSVNSATVTNASSADLSTVQGVGPEEGVECSGGRCRTVDCLAATTRVGNVGDGGNAGQHVGLSPSGRGSSGAPSTAFVRPFTVIRNLLTKTLDQNSG